MLPIVYEDASILIIDKPQDLPAAPGKLPSLCEVVFKEYPYLSKVKGYKENEGGLLNRLDNETGGLTFFAKTDEAFKYYFNEMKNNRIIKIYTTVVEGSVNERNGIINKNIFHDKKNIKKMTYENSKKIKRGHSQKSITKWKLIKKFKDRSMLEVEITKGKRHQIRVHLASIGHPICGDKLYNKNNVENNLKYILLYATGVVFNNYVKNKKTEVRIEAPF